MADAMPQLAWIAHGDGVIHWYNRRWHEYTGTTPQQMDDEGWHGAHDPQMLPKVLEQWKASITSGEPFEMEFPLRGADGVFRPFLTRAQPFRDAHGRIVQWFGTNTDVGELKRAEDALRASQQMLRNILDHFPGVVFWKDRNSVYLGCNKAFAQGAGLAAPDAIIGKTDHDLPWAHFEADAYRADDRAVMDSGIPKLGIIETQVQADGRILWFETNKIPLLDAAGNVMGVLGTANDITQRKRAEEERHNAQQALAAAKSAAEGASRAKDHFIAVLSHELRNPLNPVLATVSMLQSDPRFDSDTREQLQIIRRNTELQAKLIEDLLDVTRIERGKVELHRRPVELGTIIRWAAEVCMPDIEARKLQFGIVATDKAYLVDGDAARLQQVFWNLISNAVKFTPPGGHVRIHCRRDGAGHVLAEVSDSGKGIAPEMLPRLFNAFEQGEPQTTRQFGGLGLGLSISKTLVELHGGTLTASSEGPGKGATFTVRLPMLAAGAEMPPAPTTSRSPLRATPARSLRILLVEDHRDTAMVMKRLLSASGHQVQTAADVAAALKLAQEQTFDLLLSDLGLPDGSGVEVMRSIRRNGSTLPGIALSGYGQEQDVQQSHDAGFAAHLTKPIDIHRLERTIERVVNAQASC